MITLADYGNKIFRNVGKHVTSQNT